MSRWIALFSALLFALALLPASLSAQGAGLLTRSVVVDGRLRTFRVHLPAGHDPSRPTPVVVFFHGGGGNAQSAQAYGWNATADRHDFIVAYPEGTGPLGPSIFRLLTWNAGSCCSYARDNAIDDVAFTAALLDTLEAEWTIDTNRIGASGFSNGAMMSYRVGMELSHRFSAIAPVGGTRAAPFTADRPLPLIVLHGALDANVPASGGIGSGVKAVVHRSQADAIAPFAANNGVAPLPSTPDLVLGQARRFRSVGAAPDATISYWELLDGGHTWPGVPAQRNPNEPIHRDLDANETIWAFFDAHPRRRAQTVLAPGCGFGTAPAPSLLSSPPALGRPLELKWSGAPRRFPGALFVALPPVGPRTLTSLGFGCDTPLDLASVVGLGDLPTAASGSIAVPLPLDATLLGLQVETQILWLVAGRPITSPALALTLEY